MFGVMAGSGKIIDLRSLLAARYPHPVFSAQTGFESGVPEIDAITGGGFPKGGITEIVTPRPSSGSATLLHALARKVAEANTFLALIDGRDSFDPSSLGRGALRHLLWLRCQQAQEAVKAADLLLRDGNFPVIALDLVLNSESELRKIPPTNWYRLQRLVEPTSTALLVLARRSMVGSAQIKLLLQHSWELQDLDSGGAGTRLRFNLKRAHAGRASTGTH